jgi:hypothetical protein
METVGAAADQFCKSSVLLKIYKLVNVSHATNFISPLKTCFNYDICKFLDCVNFQILPVLMRRIKVLVVDGYMFLSF